ncbi:MAG: exodeoxyribonuclease VII large subunit [Gammaproteobacteria bacterium]|nr:exodeoxyribonuclease VII large subunit [Gammaproteobacteria bacterium]
MAPDSNRSNIFSSNSNPSDTDVFTVSRLNREARRLLEGGLPNLWVSGEISNLARPGSGHIYFTLKDDKAQVSCAMFRGNNRKLNFHPEDGSLVLLQARVSIYEARGNYQLIVEHMEDGGEGLLRRKFEDLKARLSKAGLFDVQHKQNLPKLPGRIGIITSPTGAAIRDILHILKRRFPTADIIIYPTRVQGDGANDEIIHALQVAINRNECDVLIIARGGGSLEDLWSFNEENVARAIYDCPLPIISGVGHEIDFTITDLVADVRAPTPSGAAELVTPDKDELLRTFTAIDRRAELSLRRLWAAQSEQHKQLSSRLNRIHPGAVLGQLQQRSDELIRRLTTSTQEHLETQQAEYQQLTMRLRNAVPAEKLARLTERLNAKQQQLTSVMRHILNAVSSRAAITAGSLNAVSPLATLERGYAIVWSSTSGKLLNNAGNLKPGDRIKTQLAKGQFEATVEKTIPEKPTKTGKTKADKL